jgi:hypothetical protein
MWLESAVWLGDHERGDLIACRGHQLGCLVVGPAVEDLGKVTEPVDARDEHAQLAVLSDGVTHPLAAQDQRMLYPARSSRPRIFSSALPVTRALVIST